MPIINSIAAMQDEIATWRRDFHEHPELQYDVHRTAGIVADKLRAVGCDEVVTGIGNNGSYICDATAVLLRIVAGDEPYEAPGVDVTRKIQSVFQGKFRTDLGKYADLFGDPAPGQEKTLRLRVQDLAGRVKYLEFAEDAPIVLP